MKQILLNLFRNKSCSHAWRWWVAGGTVLAALTAFPSTVEAQVIFPSLPGLNFQTSGRARCARIGDWYTTNNQAGCQLNAGPTTNPATNRLHRISIDITQEMLNNNGGVIPITILDAESNGLLDEIGNATLPDPGNNAIGSITCNTLPNNCDPTRFQLVDTDGVTVLDTRTIGTTTGTVDPNNTQITFNVTAPGTYTITSETGAEAIFGAAFNAVGLNDDDNGFSISVPIIVGSSQQALIGQSQSTFQHNTGGNLTVPLYFLVGPGLAVGGNRNLFLRNFDLDENVAAGTPTVTYTSPNGVISGGTVSTNAIWNGGGTINTGGDNLIATGTTQAVGGDAGIWGLTINTFTNNNQSLIEAQVDGQIVPLFDNPPSRAGNFVITPDSDLTTTVGTEVCHAFTVTNNFFTNDIINLTLSGTDPNYTVQLRQADGVTPLTDLDGDGAVDTGILIPRQTGSYTLCVTPTTPNVIVDTTLITGTSFMDRKIQPTTYLERAQSVTKITRIPPPDLSITKTHTGNFVIGQQGTYTLTVTNAPTASPTSGTITVTDTLPANLTFVSGTGTGWTCSATGQTVTCTNPGPFNPGDTSTITLVVNAVSEGDVTNSVTVSTPNETNTTDNTDTDPTTITPVADLSLTKTVNISAPVVGQNITYIVTLNNNGPSNATGVAVSEQIPASLTFVSATPSQGTYNNTTGLWTVGNVANGGNATLTVTATVNGAGSVTNTAQVSASDQPDTDSTPNNNVPGEDDQASTTITPILPADLSLTKTVNTSTPVVGGNITYTVTLTNDGPANATGVAVTEQLPAGLTFVSATPSQGTYNNTTGLWTVGAVNNGANATLSVTARVNGTGSITNTAQVSASDQPDTDSTPNNNVPGEDDQGGITITPVQPADLSITKTVNTTTPVVGGNITYTVTLNNAGPANATGVAVTEQLPAGLTFVSATPSQGTYNNTTGLWTVGSVNNGANATLTITATVTGTGSITNTAQVSASDQPDIDSTPNNNDPGEDDQGGITITPVQPADLSITKTVNTTTPVVGGNITYTVTLNNAGPANATGVAVTEQLPAGLTFVSATPSQGTYNNTTGLWTVGSVNNGANATLTITATVTGTDSITNTAQVSASDQPDTDSTPNNNVPGEDDQSSTTITPTQQQPADLSLAKTVNIPNPIPGQNVTYTLTVSNAGPATATNVQVTDVLPAGLTFISASNGGTFNATTRQVVWNLPSVGVNGTATVTVTARVNTQTPQTNTAQITASDQPDPDSTPGNNNPDEDDQASVTIPTLIADLSLAKTVSDTSPTVGENITYTLTVRNAGPANATNIQITDRLPAGLTFVSASSGGTFNPTTREIIWNLPAVAVNASTNLTITATVNTTAALTNSAQVTASDQFDPDSTPGNNNPNEDDQASVSIGNETVDLSILKTVDNGSPATGDTITYTMVVRNLGPGNATNVQISDELPNTLTFVSASSGGTFNATNRLITWSFPAIPADGTVSVTVTATVNTTTPVTNTARITGLDQTDTNPNNNQSSQTIPAEEADLSVRKTVDNQNAEPGDQITYTVTVSNAGPDAATNVELTDRLPAGLTFNSATPSQGTYNNTNGVWTVGNLPNGASATLRITATLNTSELVTNTAQVTGSDQVDPDSTPGNSNPNEDDQASVSLPTRPNLRLVKRVTALNTTTFTDLVDDPSDPDDNAPNWPANFLQGRIDNVSIQPGDEVEYTIYFLSDGSTTAGNVTLCDLVPPGLLFSPNGYGNGQGIALLNGGVQTFLSNAGDTDGGQFYPAGSFVPPPAGGQSPQPCGRANTNGAIVVNVGDVPSATGTNPAGSVGFIRFRARFIE